MIEDSRNLKISIYVNFSDTDNEEIEDVCVLLLEGKRLVRGRLLGKNIDETDDELKEKILTEEVDKELFDPSTFRLGLRNINTSIEEIVIEEIFSCLKTLKSTIMKMDGSFEYEDQYVIYHDNKESSLSDFFYKLCDYIDEHDDCLAPMAFRHIYTSTTDIKSIFSNYGYDNIMYIGSSTISNAIFAGIALDFSLGYR